MINSLAFSRVYYKEEDIEIFEVDLSEVKINWKEIKNKTKLKLNIDKNLLNLIKLFLK